MKSRYTIDQFRAAYPTNDACLEKIWQLRYGHNLVCPKCENTDSYYKVKGRRSYQCKSCANQIYPTQGTIFEKTTTPLTYWFMSWVHIHHYLNLILFNLFIHPVRYTLSVGLRATIS